VAGKPIPVEQILEMLAKAPGDIAAAAEGAPPELLCTSPGPGEWSARDVLAHMRSCADVWGGCIRQILQEERPVIRAVDPRTWARSTNYLELDFETSLREYTAQRRELLDLLRSLPPDAWQREADVVGAGKPLVRTVHFYAQWLAKHERPHLKQIRRVIKTLRGGVA
jgi:hypothetical protein